MKKCKVCRKPFTPSRPMQMVCSGLCGLAYAKKLRTNTERTAEKAERRALKTKIEATYPLSHWVKQTQAAFNAYIRERDRLLACISCNRTDKNSWDAGHYLTTGARPELRFDEDNVHRQCVQCNQHFHGNVALMRVGMVKRIGIGRVERLEGPHPPQKYTADDLKAMTDHYRSETRRLKATHP